MNYINSHFAYGILKLFEILIFERININIIKAIEINRNFFLIIFIVRIDKTFFIPKGAFQPWGEPHRKFFYFHLINININIGFITSKE
jgi:hypothetical protein